MIPSQSQRLQIGHDLKTEKKTFTFEFHRSLQLIPAPYKSDINKLNKYEMYHLE